MAKKYDVIIIGAGPGGIFCAYELMEKKPDLKVLMIEKGRSIEKRTCPKRVTKQCVGCKPCSITTGFAGAGAFSDGKLSLSPRFCYTKGSPLHPRSCREMPLLSLHRLRQAEERSAPSL